MKEQHNANKKPIVNVTTPYGKIIIYDEEPNNKDKEN
jgi:hypothetical protein